MLLLHVTLQSVSPRQRLVTPFDRALDRTGSKMNTGDVFGNAPRVEYCLAFGPPTSHLGVGSLPLAHGYRYICMMALKDVRFDASGGDLERAPALLPFVGVATRIVEVIAQSINL